MKDNRILNNTVYTLKTVKKKIIPFQLRCLIEELYYFNDWENDRKRILSSMNMLYATKNESITVTLKHGRLKIIKINHSDIIEIHYQSGIETIISAFDKKILIHFLKKKEEDLNITKFSDDFIVINDIEYV